MWLASAVPSVSMHLAWPCVSFILKLVKHLGSVINIFVTYVTLMNTYETLTKKSRTLTKHLRNTYETLTKHVRNTYETLMKPL